MFPTIVRWRVRSTDSSTIWLSSSTAMRDSCFVALITISRAICRRDYVILRATTKDRLPRTIYFSGSISGGRGDVTTYRRMIEALEKDGHRVLAGSVAAEHISDAGDPLSARDVFDRDLKWIEEADVLVAEVSTPSTGVGYEIAAARYRYGIPVICLYRP